MDENQRLLFSAAIVNAALYLSAVVIAALSLRNPVALDLALVALGLAALSYNAQAARHRRSAAILTGLSQGAGIGAGVFLIGGQLA